MSTANQFVQRLPAPFGRVLETTLQLREPFMDLIARFAGESGTVALLSGGRLDSARFHVLGLRPWLTLRECGGTVSAEFSNTRIRAELDPFDALEAVAARYRLSGLDQEHPLTAGLLGYLAYDLKDCLEALPRTSRDDLGLPRVYMTAPSILVVHDRQRAVTTVHVPVLGGDDEAARQTLSRFQEELSTPPPVRRAEAKVGELVSGLSRDEYLQRVHGIRDYIARGHVYQVNMSQRFEAAFDGDAFALFAALFDANPAPFFAYLQAGDHQIVSTSPERFIELRGTKVETRPIKGTRRRGKTPDEDAAFRRDLETSAKDDAELSMIVDLLRNDIGKVCAAGSVKVVEHKRVEAYENVYHLVSLVEGELDAGKTGVDLLRATFPGGSITGCPKIRAMEVIDELEPVRRHVYTGAIGYLGFRGSLDFNIAIRTATVTQGRLVYSVGGGVVYDSDADDEFEETLHKGRTLAQALERFGGGAGAVPDTRVGWIDGKFRPLSELLVSVEEEGFAYGFGFFETIRVERGKALRLDAHVARFRKAWEAFFGAPFPDITWQDVISLLSTQCGLDDTVAAVKLLAAAGKPGSGERGIRLVATARPYVHRLAGTSRNGLRLSVYPHGRQSPVSEHKTMNYLLSRVASNWAKEHGADEAILLNVDGSVSETNSGNLFCRIGQQLYRPISPTVLPGTFEQAVVAHLAQSGTSVESKRLTVQELKASQAVFVTNALMGAVPVTDIDGVALAPDEGFCRRLDEVLQRSA
jgi:para-aminobenzoate synthetase component I